MSILHLNIGSNQDRRKNIRSALDQLENFFEKIKVSSVFESPSEGFEGKDFYNVGVNVETNKKASEVLDILHKIEDSLGRNRAMPKFSSRSIDLDLVIYGDLIDEKINVPRKDISAPFKWFNRYKTQLFNAFQVSTYCARLTPGAKPFDFSVTHSSIT